MRSRVAAFIRARKWLLTHTREGALLSSGRLDRNETQSTGLNHMVRVDSRK
jgi:hypothetical protein